MQWNPQWRISILVDFRPKGYNLSCAVVVFGMGKDILFKSVLGHCGRLASLGKMSTRKCKVHLESWCTSEQVHQANASAHHSKLKVNYVKIPYNFWPPYMFSFKKWILIVMYFTSLSFAQLHIRKIKRKTSRNYNKGISERV